MNGVSFEERQVDEQQYGLEEKKSCARLFTFLNNFKKLEHLNIRNIVPIHNISEALQEDSTQLKNLANLKHLDLFRCNKIKMYDIRFLLEILPDLETFFIKFRQHRSNPEKFTLKNIFIKKHINLKKFHLLMRTRDDEHSLIDNPLEIEEILNLLPNIVYFEYQLAALEENDQPEEGIEINDGVLRTRKMRNYHNSLVCDYINYWTKKHP